ncbi:MAG: ester cyclase [Pseudomonadota bacterium]
MHPTKKVVRQFHKSWDMRDPDRGTEVIAEDCTFEDIARGEKLPRKEAYKTDYCRRREAFSDGLCKVENVMVSQDGKWAAVEFRNTGTQLGVLRSSLGDFQPTGKRAEVRYCSVMRVDDGKVVEDQDYCDSATIARQLARID